MAYSEQTWTNEPSTTSPISADRLNHIEAGIGAAADTADAALEQIDDLTLDDLNRVTKQGYAATQEFYRLATFPVDDSGNFASLIVTGRLGGWTTANNAYWQMLLGNRSEAYDGDTFSSSVFVVGNVEQALGVCELVAYGQPDNTAILYVRVPADRYYSFDLAINTLQATLTYTGAAVAPTGAPIWALSDTPLLQVWPTGESAVNQVRLGWGPSNDNHATPKWYVDDGLDGKVGTADARLTDARRLATIDLTTATAAATAAKSVAGAPVAPAAGDYVRLTFTNGTSVGVPTLSVNGGTAYPIKPGNQTGPASTAVTIGSGGFLLLYFDGSTYHMISEAQPLAEITDAEIGAGSSATPRAMSGRRSATIVTTARAGMAPAVHSHVIGDITASGTPSASTFLRGDGAWATPPAGGGGGEGGITQLSDDPTPELGGNLSLAGFAVGDADEADLTDLHAGTTIGRSIWKAADAAAVRTAAGAAPTSHTHVPADLGGTPSGTTFYRGDGTWQVPTNTTYTALTLAEFTTGTATTVRGVSAQVLNQQINQKITGASGTSPTTIGQNIAAAADAAAVRTLISAVDAAYVSTQIANLIASAPGALDTLDELAAALGDDPNFATTITNALALKAPLAAPALTGAATLDGQALVKTNDARLADVRTPADNSVTSAKIVDGTIATGDLADGAVTSAKIADGTITNTDIAAAAGIVATKLAAAVQTSLGLADTAVQPATLAAARLVAIRAVSGTTDTLVIGDASNAVAYSNSGAVAVTIPLNSAVAFPIGAVLELRQMGAGQVTVSAAAGATLRTSGTNKTRAQYSTLGITKIATDEWLLTGDMATS